MESEPPSISHNSGGRPCEFSNMLSFISISLLHYLMYICMLYQKSRKRRIDAIKWKYTSRNTHLSNYAPDLLFSRMDRWWTSPSHGLNISFNSSWVRFRIFLRNYTAAKPFILPCYFTDEQKGNGRPPYLSCRRRLALPIHLDGDHPSRRTMTEPRPQVLRSAISSPPLTKPKIQVTSHALTARGSGDDDGLVFIESSYGGNRVWIFNEKLVGREGGDQNIFLRGLLA
jgi:hypothetical protein